VAEKWQTKLLENEKESHTTLEEARKAKEAAERERLIGIFVVI
jgi:hypothetical protein